MVKRTNPELWIKLSLPGVGQIGPGKMELLRCIDEHQSIAAAARAMGMSYRRAWLLVEELNGLFGEPLVSKWQGGQTKGGASLTESGHRLVERYRTLVERANAANRELLAEIGRDVVAASDSGDD